MTQPTPQTEASCVGCFRHPSGALYFDRGCPVHGLAERINTLGLSKHDTEAVLAELAQARTEALDGTEYERGWRDGQRAHRQADGTWTAHTEALDGLTRTELSFVINCIPQEHGELRVKLAAILAAKADR